MSVYNKICVHCSKSYDTRIITQKYCSKECVKNYYKQKYYTPIPIVSTKNCKHCNKEYKPKKNYQLYCSITCRDDFYRQRYIAGETAQSKLRFEIFHRDKFTCQYCGSTPQDGAKLHLEHIYPAAKGGLTVKSNLITSCEKCNLGKGIMVLDNIPEIDSIILA